MRKYTKEWARAMLELNPEWMSIGVDSYNECFWFEGIPNAVNYGRFITNRSYYYLGMFEYDGDWKDTLVVRKCQHNRIVYESDWKYCPKCGESLLIK